MSRLSLRELIRSADGAIGVADFRRGTLLLAAITAALVLLVYGVYAVNHRMEWMTVQVAPFLGVIYFFCAASLLYFWYCLLAKRLRGQGRSLGPLYAMLLLIVAACAAALVDFQNRTLAISDEGWITWMGPLWQTVAIAAALIFVFLLVRGFTGKEPAA